MKTLLFGALLGALAMRLLARRETRLIADGVRMWREEELLR